MKKDIILVKRNQHFGFGFRFGKIFGLVCSLQLDWTIISQTGQTKSLMWRLSTVVGQIICLSLQPDMPSLLRPDRAISEKDATKTFVQLRSKLARNIFV